MSLIGILNGQNKLLEKALKVKAGSSEKVQGKKTLFKSKHVILIKCVMSDLYCLKLCQLGIRGTWWP